MKPNILWSLGTIRDYVALIARRALVLKRYRRLWLCEGCGNKWHWNEYAGRSGPTKVCQKCGLGGRHMNVRKFKVPECQARGRV